MLHDGYRSPTPTLQKTLNLGKGDSPMVNNILPNHILHLSEIFWVHDTAIAQLDQLIL